MEIRLLGPVELVSVRGPVAIGSAKQRALLAFLALHPQRLLTYDVLIDGLWGDGPPEGTVEALRFHVSRLRGILRQVDDAERLRTRPGGYQLVVAEDAVDVVRFEKAVAGARLARSDGATPDAVSRALHDALDLWSGPALADINGEPFVVGERRRLEELRLAATEDYLAAELAGGRHGEAVGELERMVDRHPLRERLWELLITALYQSGRQADALAAYQRLRRILADELGIEPSAPLRQLEHNVLVQDTGLARPSTSPAVWHANGDEPQPAPADAVPPHAGATARPRRGLATTALALSIVALGLFRLGVASTLIAVLAILCGTIAANRARKAGAPAARRATVAVITGIVAFSASLGLLVYRNVTPDSDTADRTEASGGSEIADRTEASGGSETADRTEVPDGSETADRTEESNEVPAGREVSTSTLQVGECFNTLPAPDPPVQPGGVTEVQPTVLLVPCEEPHEQQVYHLFELAAAPYPGDEQVRALALEQCSNQFEAYVGTAPAFSGLEFLYVWPTQWAWESGDRLGGCSLYDARGRDLTGSMAGSRR
jgi:DNA-binding SARP family transcriptional activator